MKKNYLKLIFFSAFVALVCTSSYGQEKRQTKFVKFDQSVKHQLREANNLIRENLNLSSDDELVKTQTQTDQLGFTHEKYQQYFKGIKVEFGTYKVHAKNGSIETMNGELFSAGKLNITPALSKEVAFQKAIAHTGADHYLWEYPDEAKAMDNYTKPEGELLILPAEITGKSKASLAYKFDIYATAPLSRGYLYIDAHSGEALFFNAIIKHAEKFGHIGEVKEAHKINKAEILESMFVSGTAQTRYSGTRTIETAVSGSNYILSDTGRKVYTRDALNQGSGYTNNYSEFTDNDNNWTTAEHSANKDDAALDAHWGAMMTFDYFSSVHNRNSYDGNGAQIRSYVHVNNNYDNAFWNGSVMSYGDGSSNGNEGNGYFDALTSIDVAAHEIGHAVCSYTANLAYQRESGGLNEGFSDIWGAAVEHFAKGNGNDLAPSPEVWLIGDEIDRRVGSVGLRSMSDPNERNQPDTYGGTYWQNPNCGTPTQSNDYCGVHTNSGVLNYWFYLLTAGGSGTNDVNDSFNVSAIGMTKAANIAYRTESVYLSANSTFANARAGAIQSAEDLYGAGSQEVISTTNAWYAVGVGDEYVQTCSLPAPSSLASSNVGDNGFTVTWNSVSGAASYSVTVDGSTSNTSSASFSISGLIPGTQYSVSVVANCNTGGNGVSSSINVTTTGTAPLNYCNSASTNINDEYIGRVQLATIDNTSGGQFYTDFTSISTNLTKGDSNTITVTPVWTGTVYSEGYAVWIDYNKDGDFTDSGELVWSRSATQATPVSGSFTVPTSITNGATRMRVSMKYNGIPSSCETFTYGEVEDYTVNIINGTPDTTAPIITLIGGSTINLDVGDPYNEQGATASDNIDGNITGNIVITGNVNTSVAGTYTRYYNVSDAAGNDAVQVTRTIIVTQPVDTTAPIITLNGASTINLTVGDPYNEQGATASDNFDGDISGSIVITGTVNTAVAGTYTRNYNVSDAAGNAATQVSRTINVSDVSSGCSGGISSFPYSEGFENTLGAWTQSSADNINWTVDANGTPSSNTGPSSASQGSYYIYVEASGNGTGYPNKQAILNSPCFNLSAETEATFSFKYHMYGSSNMGSITLEASNDDGATWTNLWSQSGNKGNTWLTASVNLDAYVGGSVQLRFNRITGGTWQADIAIDDVSMSNGGGNSGSGCSGGATSYPYSQGYENTLGDWTQSSADDINWTVDANGTPSSNTGPSSAIQGSYYVYVEASGNGTGYPNKQAILNSPCYDLSGQNSVTFSFNYHMYGSSNMGTIALEVSDDNGSNWTSVWNQSGNKGNSWQSANVDLSAYTGGSIQLRFNRVTGGTWQADIAIDNVNLTSSSGAIYGIVTDVEIDNQSGPFEVEIYPNPVKGFQLNVKTFSDNLDYTIYNMIGQIVAKGRMTTSSIDVSKLDAAVYIVQFNNTEESITKRFIKE